MAHIVLSEEQMKGITAGAESVEVRDARNNFLGYLRIPRVPPELIEEALRRLASNEPRLTYDQVKAHLQSLEAR